MLSRHGDSPVISVSGGGDGVYQWATGLTDRACLQEQGVTDQGTGHHVHAHTFAPAQTIHPCICTPAHTSVLTYMWTHIYIPYTQMKTKKRKKITDRFLSNTVCLSDTLILSDTSGSVHCSFTSKCLEGRLDGRQERKTQSLKLALTWSK